MRPQCKITVDGKLVSGTFTSRLVSCEVTDAEGVSADTVSITLNDDPPAALPRRGATIRVWMGYAGRLVFMGAFVADEIEAEFKPYQLTITGRSADLRKAKAKQNRERHWDDKTLGDIVSQIAAEHGLTPRIDTEMGAHVYDWLGQQNESDIHFLERLAERHGATFGVKDGNLVFAAKGAGRSVSGAALTPIVVTLADLVEGTGRIRLSDRSQYKAVTASYQDREKARRVDVEEDSDAEGEAIYRLGEPFADEKEARRAAKAKARDLKRNGGSFSCQIVGNPQARAGAPLTFSGVRSGADGMPFIIETARHAFSKSGYTTFLDGKLQADPAGDARAIEAARTAGSAPVPTPAPR